MRRTVLLIFLLAAAGILHSQCLEGNCRQGKGKYRFKSSAIYAGEFSAAKPQGKGSLYYSNGDVYKGQWYQGMRHGKGSMIFKIGDRYDGQFHSDKFDGEGTYVFKDRGSFEGLWKGGKPNGFGTHHKQDSEAIAGLWEDGILVERYEEESGEEAVVYEALPNCNREDCLTGLGTFTYPDGTRYEGEFLANNPSGQGVVDYANGDHYIGYWQLDKPHGDGKMVYQNGDVLDGKWVKGIFMRGDKNLVTSESGETKIYALIVGVSRYDKFKTLKYTDDDAYRVYAFLKSPEGGAVHDNQIRILIDESATKANIDAAMDDLLMRADENDAVFCFFSGHGLNGSFLPIDSDGYKNNLTYDEMRKKLASCKAKNKLYVADACYSGSLLAARSGLTKSLDLFYDKLNKSSGGTAFLVSSKPEEYSLESQGLRQGVFSHYLIEGLKGEADLDFNQIVTIEELFNYVHLNVQDYTKNVQTPVLAGQFDKSMPVALIR